MHRKVTSWSEFKESWAGQRNFLVGGECIPFSFPFPEPAKVVEEMRADAQARISPGVKGDRLRLDDMSAEFRRLPIGEALERPFALAHFKLSVFDEPGKFLHGFRDAVLEPWRQALRDQGFSFDRCYPIIFISGKGCATNYHMDYSHVLAWQATGMKRFCGLLDPDHWAPRETRLSYSPDRFSRPPSLGEADELCYDMAPGDALWNALLTPHWVEAGDEVAISVNISHGGLRLDGKLCPFEEELEQHRREHPETVPKKLSSTY